MTMVRKLQPVVEEKVERLLDRLRRCADEVGDDRGKRGEKGVVRLDHAFAAFTNGMCVSISTYREKRALEPVRAGLIEL